MSFRILEKNTYPKELASCAITELKRFFQGPTIIHLEGRKKEAIFMSTLLHGNETTSFFVIQKLLKLYETDGLERDLIIFIGNVEAAIQGMRHLPDQVDYNRIWEDGELPENKMALEVSDYAQTQSLFASIDIHNNTGKNPFYGCVNSLEKRFLNLASFFGKHTVYFTEPHNVQSMCFSKFCTSVTIEAGLPGEQKGIEAAFKYILDIMKLDSLEGEESEEHERDNVFHTIARIKVSSDTKINFNNTAEGLCDISFVDSIDDKNFEVVHSNTHFGYAKNLDKIRVESNSGLDLTEDFFEVVDNKLLTKRVFIPSMFTKDIYVMKEDCLGYLMEIKIPLAKSS